MDTLKITVPSTEKQFHSSIWLTLFKVGFALICIGVAAYLSWHRRSVMFPPWDDEGYVLLILEHYLNGAVLYDELFTQYGPFHYHLWGLLHDVTGLPAIHNISRLFAFLVWQFCALSCAIFVKQLTKSYLLFILAYLTLNLVFSEIGGGQGHPLITVVSLLCMVLWFVLLGRKKQYLKGALFAVGFLCSALLLTKINVGVFYAMSILMVFTALLPRSQTGERLSRIIGILLVVSPFVLMNSHLSDWSATYAILASTSIGLAVWIPRQIRPSINWDLKQLGWVLAGGITGFLLIAIYTLHLGTSINGLIQGVILWPLQGTNKFIVPLRLSFPNTIAVLGVAVSIYFLYRFLYQKQTKTFDFGIVFIMAKITLGALGIYLAYRSFQHTYRQILFLAPFMWLVAAPTSEEELDSKSRLPRLALMAIAVTQVMYAYPVGTQLKESTFLLVVCSFILLYDGARPVVNFVYAQFFKDHSLSFLPKVAPIVLSVLLFLNLTVWHRVFFKSERIYASTVPLNIGGANWIRLQPSHAYTFEKLSGKIRRECDVLTSMPGLLSFNSWSKVPTPTSWNHNHWWMTMPESQQEAAVKLLKSHSCPCAVTKNSLISFWNYNYKKERDESAARDNPLAKYIWGDLSHVYEFGGYHLRQSSGCSLTTPIE